MHLLEGGLGLRTYDGELVDHGRVEHRVGILLEWEYPLAFASTHTGPAADGVGSRTATILHVADDAAQQAVVGRGDIVVGVEQDGRQRRGIDAIFLVVGYLSRQQRIQRVNALQHEHLMLIELQPLSALFAPTRMEIIVGQLHLLTAEEGGELVVEQLQVQRIDALVVELALLIPGRELAVHKIVVQRNLHGLDAVGEQLDGEPFAGGRLSTRRRAGDQHHLHPLPGGNLVGNLSDALLLQGFAHVDDVVHLPRLHGGVELAHGAESQDVLPAMVLLEDFEHLVLAGHLAQRMRVLHRRDTQQESVVIFLQPVEIELAGVGHQRAIEIVHIAVEVVVRGVERAQRLQQFHLRVGTQRTEQLDGLVRRRLVAAYGQGGVNDLLHALAQVVNVLLHDGPTDLQVAVIAVRHGDVDDHRAVGVKVAHGLAEHEEQGACIGTRTSRRVHTQKLDVLRMIQTEAHALHLVVHLGRYGAARHIFLVGERAVGI